MSVEHTPPSAEELLEKFDDILRYTRTEGDSLGRWRYPNEPEDAQRIFTPWFGTRSNYIKKGSGFETESFEQVDTRLHICPPRSWAPQPIIHIEKRAISLVKNNLKESIYEGAEIVLNTQGAPNGISTGIYYGESRHHLDLLDVDNPYAFDVLRSIRQAHDLVVRPALEEV